MTGVRGVDGVDHGARRPALGALMVIGAALLWGSLGLFGRLAFAHGATALEVSAVRATLAFLGILPLALFRPRRLRLRTRHLPLVIGYGAIGVGFFYWIYLVAVDHLPLAVAAALLYTAPAFVVALSWALRWEPVRPERLVPLAMVLIGAFLVTGAFRTLASVVSSGAERGGTAPAVFGAPEAAVAGIPLVGILAGVGSGVAYALYTVLGKRIRQHYDVFTTVFYAYGIGALVLSVAAPPWTVFAEHPEAAPAMLLMGLGPTLVAALLFYGGIRHIDASTASMLATIEPVVAALIGLAWLGEGLPGSTLAGTGLILAAALLLRPGRSSAGGGNPAPQPDQERGGRR